jgi:hypothetical protein
MKYKKSNKDWGCPFLLSALTLVLMSALLVNTVRLYSQNSSLQRILAQHETEKRLRSSKKKLNVDASTEHSLAAAVPLHSMTAGHREDCSNKLDFEEKPVIDTQNPGPDSGDTLIEPIFDASKAALDFIREHGYGYEDLASLDQEKLLAIMDDIYFNAYDLESKLESTRYFASLDTEEHYLSENIITSLTQEVWTDTENAEEIMQAVYNLGGHPSQMQQLTSLSENENPEVARLATKTIIEMLLNFEYSGDLDDDNYPAGYEEAQIKMAEKLIENPSLIFSIK